MVNCFSDIDECATQTDNCSTLSTECSNFQGGYECQCKKGYKFIQGDDFNCEREHATFSPYENISLTVFDDKWKEEFGSIVTL